MLDCSGEPTTTVRMAQLISKWYTYVGQTPPHCLVEVLRDPGLLLWSYVHQSDTARCG